MKIKIHTDEGLELLKFHTDITRHFEEDSVEPVENNEQIRKYVTNFLKKRGIKRPKIWECGTYTFRNVDMHVDNVLPKSAGTLMLMIDGNGELLHWDGKRMHYTQMGKIEGIFFDFNLPHAFKSKKKCQALLIDIPKKYKKYLYEYNC